MKVINKVLVVGAMITSFAPMAAVELALSNNVAAVVVHGEEVGFSISKKSQFEFENGTNQIVIRVSQLVSNLGEREKFNSSPVVVTFDSSDSNLEVSTPYKITRTEQAKEFNKSPYFLIVDQDGNEIKTTQEVLPASSGISRDYEKELARYNAKNNITIASTTTATAAMSTVVKGKVKPESTVMAEATTKPKMPSEMVEYWYAQANTSEQTAFTNWVFENRKKAVSSLESESQSLQMLSYWYSQADKNQRSQILTWLVNQ